MSVATTSPQARTFSGGAYVAQLMAELSRAAISGRIKQARKQAGLNQQELADVLHVHYRSIQDWENPKMQVVPFDRLDEIGQTTGVTRQWLLHGEETNGNHATDAQELRGEVAAVRRMLEEILRRLPPQ